MGDVDEITRMILEAASDASRLVYQQMREIGETLSGTPDELRQLMQMTATHLLLAEQESTASSWARNSARHLARCEIDARRGAEYARRVQDWDRAEIFCRTLPDEMARRDGPGEN